MDYRPLTAFAVVLGCCAFALGIVRRWRHRQSARRAAAAAVRRAKLDRAWAARDDATADIAR